MRCRRIFPMFVLLAGLSAVSALADDTCVRRTFRSAPGRGGAGAALISVARCDSPMPAAAAAFSNQPAREEPRFRPDLRTLASKLESPAPVRVVKALRLSIAAPRR